MYLVNTVVSFIKKYKTIILIGILLYVSIIYLNIKEEFYATNCTQFKSCVDCVNGKVFDTSSPCYWSSEKKKCGSFNDLGYSRQCSKPPSPGPNGPCPVCKKCPKLTLLKNPTYITKQ